MTTRLSVLPPSIGAGDYEAEALRAVWATRAARADRASAGGNIVEDMESGGAPRCKKRDRVADARSNSAFK